jgi:hypothetical protein
MPSRWFKSVLVLAVLTLWTAASAHCALEATGLWGSATVTTESGECCDPTDQCSRDACDLVEDADFAQPQADLKAPAPQLSVELCLRCVQVALTEMPLLEVPVAENAATLHPPTWMPSRHAVRRASAPVRAPARLV